MDDLKAGNSENFVDKLEALDGHFMEIRDEESNKFDKMEKELIMRLHKISINFDDKIKGIEKRLMKNFEDVLEDKLAKILSKSGSE